tara:strand:- start:853 stop:1068 length:216 start_codon:yes stop_codon:yes gene_type:complete
MWDDLPDELKLEIFKARRNMRLRTRASIRIQSRWRAHRTRTLVHRFVLLKFLSPFRRHVPSPVAFLNRVRL